jgi:branched-chain amino acid transport system substrate-binding protein
MFDRRRLLQNAAWTSGMVAGGVGSWLLPAPWASAADPIKVGVATDLTGPISFDGIGYANVATMVTDDINAKGGLLRRPLELYIEDTASEGWIGESSVRRLIEQHRVDVVLGGITSAMRNAIKDVIVTEGRTLYIYPTLYEGTECTPYLFCTGPTPAQQCDHFIPWLIANGGKRFALPAADYVWPRKLNEYARRVIEGDGGEVVFEEYYPFDQFDHSATVNRILSEDVDVVFYTVIPPGVEAFVTQLYKAGFQARGGRLACPYYDDNAANLNAPYEWEGLATCLDYFRVLASSGEDPFMAEVQAAYDERFPGKAREWPWASHSIFAQSTAVMYRSYRLWEAAVNEAGSVARDDVAAALDHARIEHGPGGPAEMVPGTRHCRMNMYIAVAKDGEFEIVWRSPGLLDPKACV